MSQLSRLSALEPRLAAVNGTVSVWYGPIDGPPVYTRLADETHYAASTMKTAVMVAAHRLAEAGQLDLDASIPVHDDFESVAGTGRFRPRADNDSDPESWQRLGGEASLHWLIERMIIRSGNLATNLLLEQTGFPAVNEVWRLAGAKRSVVVRGIEDFAGAEAGHRNVVTAADLAALLRALYAGRLAGPAATAQMLDILLAQELGEDVVAGLPPGTPVAHKSGWVNGVRHNSALVLPPDRPGYVQVICISASLDEAELRDLVQTITAAVWADHVGG